MSGFLGSDTLDLSERGRITLPARFRKDIARGSDVRSQVVALAPCRSSIALVPAGLPICNSEGLRTFAWAESLREIIMESRVNPADPIHAGRRSGSLRMALGQLREAMSQDAGLVDRMTGHEFEQFIKNVFEAFGIAVQANVRVLGAEVDLLLLHNDGEHGIEFSIVECKHRSRSRSKIDIHEVMRVFGLAEALNTVLPIRNRVLVTTQGYTTPAAAFAETYGLRAADYEQVIEWAEQSHAASDTELPIFRIATLGVDGRLHLDSTLRNYLGSPDQLLVVGALDRIEFWNEHQFVQEVERPGEDVLRQDDVMRLAYDWFG